jgi:hypothetical protein
MAGLMGISTKEASLVNKKLAQPSKEAYKKLFKVSPLLKPYLKFAFSLLENDCHRFRRSWKIAMELV